MSRFRLVLLAAVALALAGAAVVTLRLQRRGSPVYSLRQLADAARARDRAAIERYLDVGRTAESVVDEANSTAGALDADPSLKPSLIIAVQQSIWTALLDSLPTLEGRYQGLAGVEERGDVARVGVRIRAVDADSAFVVHLRMERAAGRWRVVGIEDLGPYLQASLGGRQERAHEAEMRSTLRSLVTAQEMYFADHGSYTRSLGALTYYTPPGVSVEVIDAGRDGWRAVARHADASVECRIAVGSAATPGDIAREPRCVRLSSLMPR